MYANLRVTVKGPAFADQPAVYAWDMDITEDAVVVKLDGNKGEGDYADEVGQIIIPRAGHTINVEASF